MKIFTDGQTLRGDEGDGGQRPARAPAPPRSSAAPPPARRARRTTTPTRGSTGSRRSLNTAVWVGYPGSTQSMSAVPGYGPMFGGKAPGADLARLHARRRCRAARATSSRSPRSRSRPSRSSASTPRPAPPAAATTRSREDDADATDTTTEKDEEEGQGGQEVPAEPVRVAAAVRPGARAADATTQESAPVAPTGGVGIG